MSPERPSPERPSPERPGPERSSPDEAADAVHPTVGLDDTIHQRSRLGILAMLRSGVSIEFAVLRDQLHLTDGNLNRHLKVLESAGHVASERRTGRGRPRTWVTITPHGAAALADELAALRALLSSTE